MPGTIVAMAGREEDMKGREGKAQRKMLVFF
jgi:hypothetical protein